MYNAFDDVSELWSKLVDYGIATEETLEIITNINGYSVETLNDVIYATTGYRDIDQYESEFED